MSEAPIRVVVFDIIETLFSLEVVRDALGETGLTAADLETWFAFGLRDAFALDATHAARPFPDILRGALDQLLAIRGLEAAPDARDRVMAAFADMPAQTGAADAIETLRDAGLRLVALSNGPAERTTRLLESAGLRQSFEHVLSVQDVQRFKPHAAVYQQTFARTGEAPEAHCMVACHAWDTHGAKCAGMRAAFVRRSQVYPSTMAAPDVIEHDLADVARAIVRAWT